MPDCSAVGNEKDMVGDGEEAVMTNIEGGGRAPAGFTVSVSRSRKEQGSRVVASKGVALDYAQTSNRVVGD